MRGFGALLQSEMIVLTRDRALIVFTLAFPILFILIFGALMGGMGDAEDARLAIYSQTPELHEQLLASLEDIGGLTIVETSTEQELDETLLDRDVDFALLWDGRELIAKYDAARTQENYAYQQLAQGIGAQLQLAAQNLTPVYAVVSEPVGGEETSGWFDRVVPGILAFSILSSGLFAVSGHISNMKHRKLLDRLLVTPMNPSALIGAIALVRLAIIFVSTLLSLLLAVGIYRVAFAIDWFRYIAFLIASTLGTMGMGTLIALLVRQPSSASNLANILAMSMMFVSGIYFPVEIMPAFFRSMSRFLPLTHMAEAMRYVTGVADLTETYFWSVVAALAGIGLLLLPVLSRYVVRPDRH